MSRQHKKVNCKDCKCFEGDKNRTEGYCRRYAPRNYLYYQNSAQVSCVPILIWPRVKCDDWCREFEGKSVVASMPDIHQVLNRALAGIHHAEMVVQSRLYNYLVAASIVALCWVAVLLEKDIVLRQTILFVLASSGAAFSFLWMILGCRQRKFLQVHTDILLDLEGQLPSDKLKYSTAMAELQKRGWIELRASTGKVMLWWIEWKVNPRLLLILVPAIFLLAFFLFFCFSLKY